MTKGTSPNVEKSQTHPLPAGQPARAKRSPEGLRITCGFHLNGLSGQIHLSDAQFFNLFNHPSFDAPNNNISLNPCFSPNLQASQANGCTWQATVPALSPATKAFSDSTAPFGPGFAQATIGSPRLIQYAVRLNFY